jgi:ABC-2 type transport system permease protein
MSTASAAAPAMTRETPGLMSRIVGLGSVFGKTFRDSRRTALILGAVTALILLVTTASVAGEFSTVEKRLGIAAQMAALPEIFQGMLGRMLNIERIGGFLSWRTINFLPIIFGIWTVVAMSGLLAGELARGSLDLLAASPLGRARLAVEKVGGYLLALLVTLGVFAIAAWGAIAAFGTLPIDPVGADAVAAHAAWLYVVALLPGALAFAVAPVLGRGGALAVGSLTLFGSFIVSGYAQSVSFFETLQPLSYLSLTENHRPIAGAYDWPSVVVAGGITAALLVAGVVLFVWRDMLVPTGGRIRVPSIPLFVGGIYRRSLGERLPASILWGLGLGLYGMVIAFSADEFVKALGGIPEIQQLIAQLFPNVDIASVGGFLQIAFFSEAILFVAVATTLLVSGWSSDEGEHRLELVLSTPTARLSWGARSALAVMTGVAIITALLVVGVIAGALTQTASLDTAQVAIGVSILGLYAMALAGVGLAVGGIVRPSLAAPVTIALALGFFLWDLVGSIAKFPDALLDLALNRHLGQPMLGQYDWPGMALCAALAIGGVALCAIGMRRRDIGR